MSAKSLAPRAPSRTEQRAEKKGKNRQRKVEVEEDGRRMQEKQQKLDIGYYRGSGHSRKSTRLESQLCPTQLYNV